MVLSKRERTIAVITVAILLLFVADRYVWAPVMDARERVRLEKQELLVEMQQADRMFRRQSKLSRQWKDMREGGLGSNASEMESRVLNAVREWSAACGLPLTNIKPDRGKTTGDMGEILFNLALTGGMESVGRFLWQVENSSLPIRIQEFQLGSRSEDGSDMSLQLKLSALYLADGSGETGFDTESLVGDE